MFQKILVFYLLCQIIHLVRPQETERLIDFIDFFEKLFVNIFLTDCNVTKQILASTYAQIEPKPLEELGQVTLHLYTENDKIVYKLNESCTEIIESPHFDKTLPTIIVTHGYGGHAEGENIKELAMELKNLRSNNVLMLDHSVLMNTHYYYASTMVQIIGEGLGEFLANMHSNGVTKFHLIAHSVGSHIFGFAGKTFKRLTGINIDHITGLDPAGPCFFDESPDKRLCSTDADFVDVIHTDTFTYGIGYPIGHVDFYPNSGDNMPGCLFSICSHIRSIKYYVESIKKDNFIAKSCDSYAEFVNGSCKSNPDVKMGFWLPSTVKRGIYYLKTSSDPLYGLGIDGI